MRSGVSVLAALAVALIAWSVHGVAQRPLAIVLAGSAVALAAGAVLGLALYPWTNLPVLGFAIAGGILVGRRLPPRPMPMLVLLAVLAALDAIQIVASGPGPGPGSTGGETPAWYFYGMLVIDTAWTHTGVGIFDVLVIAAMVEHARRRGLPRASRGRLRPAARHHRRDRGQVGVRATPRGRGRACARRSEGIV